MSMHFKFSRGFGACQAVRSVVHCCCSNTHSADLLLEQHRPIQPNMGHVPDDTGGL